MFRPVIISLLALIILAFEANAGESADHCKDALPKNLQGAIAAKYNGWRVVHDGKKIKEKINGVRHHLSAIRNSTIEKWCLTPFSFPAITLRHSASNHIQDAKSPP